MGVLKTHNRVKLCTLLQDDLLTAREKWIKKECGGLVSFTETEDAIVKNANDKSSISFDEFRRKLKKIDKQFDVIFCDVETLPQYVQGHQIIFCVVENDGTNSFVPICRVGRNRDRDIPAHTQGKVSEWRGKIYKATGDMDQRANWFRGYLGALGACEQKLESWKKNGGIMKGERFTAQEVGLLKKAYDFGYSSEAVNNAITKGLTNEFLRQLASGELKAPEEAVIAEPVPEPEDEIDNHPEPPEEIIVKEPETVKDIIGEV